MTITAAILEATLKKLGYKFFTEGDYNLNIIGIRNSATGAKVTNAFDDNELQNSPKAKDVFFLKKFRNPR